VAEGERRFRRWQLRPTERQMILILGDIIVAMLAMVIAMFLWARPDWLAFGPEFIRARAGWFVLLPLIWPLFMINLYDVRWAGSWRETVRGVMIAAVVGMVVYLGLYFFRFEPGSLPRRGPVYFLAFVVVLTLGWRRLYIWIFTRPSFRRRMLIVGAGESGTELLDVLEGLDSSPFYVVGLIDDDPSKAGKHISGVPVLGDNTSILPMVRKEDVTGIVMAITGIMQGAMFQAILDAQERGVEIIRMPVLYEELLNRVPIKHLESDWLLRSFVDEVRVSRIYLILKRCMDLIGASVGLLIFALAYPWVAMAILLEIPNEGWERGGNHSTSSNSERCDRMQKQMVKQNGRVRATLG